MGTRNLTMVIDENNKTKVAQYGQWDGYPEGQGATIIEFLKNVGIDKLKECLKKVRFETKKDKAQKEKFLESIGVKEGWMDSKQATLYHNKYRFDNRDYGAEILEMICDSEEEEIVLVDSSSFAEESLFCEWCYIIDLHKNTLEVYEGFNEEKLSPEERFYKEDTTEGYYPVKLCKSFDLNAIPNKEEFIEYFTEKESENQ